VSSAKDDKKKPVGIYSQSQKKIALFLAYDSVNKKLHSSLMNHFALTLQKAEVVTGVGSMPSSLKALFFISWDTGESSGLASAQPDH
jgi:hypothetical protein